MCEAWPLADALGRWYLVSELRTKMHCILGVGGRGEVYILCYVVGVESMVEM